jgi:hypothetical protein
MTDIPRHAWRTPPSVTSDVFKAHVNVGLFLGAELDDPEHLLEGTGRRMRHVKVRPGTDLNFAALGALIEAAYTDIKWRLEADGP